MKTGKLVRQHRLELGITQKELAKRSGVPATTLSKLELGKYNFDSGPGRKILRHIGPGLATSLRQVPQSSPQPEVQASRFTWQELVSLHEEENKYLRAQNDQLKNTIARLL